MDLYKPFKNIAFRMDPELVHEFALNSFKRAPFLAEIFPHVTPDPERYGLKVAGLHWSFPVGLAAGLDKNAQAIDFFSRLGFGAIEVGTVTPRPQRGNPRPRLFRYPREKSLRNSMGFNNQGALLVLKNIESSHRSKILGVNMGKNKDTPLERAVEDYQILYRTFCHTADYLVINVSSPNTPGLRDLQKKEELKNILQGLAAERAQKATPLFVKISPDLAEKDVEEVVELALEFKLNGLIATNTTQIPDLGAGGISGKLLRERAKNIRKLTLHLTKKTPLEVIGVGGISSFSDLWEFWKLGGKVVQIYTSFIYEGPGVLVKMKKDLDKKLKQYGAQSVVELQKALAEEIG